MLYFKSSPLVAAAAALMVSAGAFAQDIIKSHGISTFGDLKYPADFTHFDYVNPDAPQGGTISFRGTGASTTFDSFNGFILKGNPAQGLGLLHDTLLTGSGDEPDSSYVYVAESIEYPEDRSWVQFVIREGAQFNNGAPITADDLVFSLNILKTEGHPWYGAVGFKDIVSAEAIDDRTIKYTFAEGANTRDLPATAGGIPILSKAYWEGREFSDSSLDIPVSSGQMTIRDFEPGRYIEYCKIPDYWLQDHPANVGSGNFDCYRYEYFTDSSVAFEGFKAGEFLFHEEFTSKNWATLYTPENFPALAKGYVIKENLPDARPSGTQGFWINMRKEKFQDPRVREALGYMFNFEWSNQALFYGIYERTDSFWENSDLQASGELEGAELAILEEFRDQLDPSIFSEPAFVPPILKPNQFDRGALRKANKLLDEAGWKLENGVRKNAAGEELVVELFDDGPAFERIINPVVQTMNRAGIKTTFRIIDAAQMLERQENYDYDIVVSRLVMSLSPGEELMSTYGSVGADEPGQSNFSGLKHPVVDELILRIAAAETREDMANHVRALDRVLRAQHIWIPNWYKGSHNVAYWDIFGRPDTKPKFSRGVIGTWWLDEDKLARLKAEGALD